MSKKPLTGVCALCQQSAELQRSHIIPKFTQQDIKKVDGRMLRFTKTSHPDGDPVQDAFWEYLLCKVCEQRFQKWEDYTARLIYQKRLFDFPPTNIPELRLLKNLNYSKLKLFFLSVLWRMGVSSQKIFQEVRLGPHEDRLRTMLLAENPGKTTDYGSTIVVVHLDGERAHLTRPGDVVRHKTHRIYRALIDGLLVTWIVGTNEHMQRFDVPQMLLQEKGHWLTHSKDLKEIAFISEETNKLFFREGA